MYLVESDRLKVAATFGFTPQEEYLKEFMIGEGLVGKSALEQQRIVLNDVAEDHVGIASGLGDVLPANIMIVPLTHEDVVMGVMEIGFSEPITERQIELVNQTEDSIAIALNSALARKQMQRLLAETQAQAEELASQKEELEQVQEELQQSNQFLEKQAVGLAQQKGEIEEKNELVKSKVKELETAGRYKSEFLANMSHELRTPLNSLLILSQLLSENKDGNLTAKQVEFARTIHGSGADLLDLISDILDLSKVEAGKMEIHLEDVRITNLTESLNRTFLPMAEQKKLEFGIETSEGVPEIIHTDGQRLEQIIKNFLSNAFKFTEEGKIVLKLHPAEKGTRFFKESLSGSRVVGFSVSDTGKGISQDKQDHIFEAFQQEDGTTSRKFGGTGLGLSISRELSRLLAGEIHLKSEEGSGSTFTVYIPENHPDMKGEKDPAKIHAIPQESRASVQKDSGPLSILIIEDDPLFSSFVSEVAHRSGFEAIVAGDGELGLELAKKNPTAIILDMTLPGINGLEVMKKINADSQTQDIPVYFISAQYDKVDDALEMGAVEFIKKPVDFEKMKEVFAQISQRAGKTARQILVVEDNKVMQDSMVSLLSNVSMNVLTAETTEDALKKLRNHRFDCMTVDLGLNGKSGLDLLHEIKNDKTLANILVIIYTGKNLTLRQEEELECFSKTVIIKGAKSPERLLDEINGFLNRTDRSSEKIESVKEIDKEPEEKEPLEGKPTEALEIPSEKINALFENKKVLVADDDMRNVFALTHLLEEHKINVVVARNGKEAIDVLQSNHDTDLILMDIMMPEMDGYTAIQEIRKDEELSEIPIIAITAKAMKNDKKKCLDAGANDYLTKPIDQNQLFTQMSLWLEKNRKMNGSLENEQ